MREDEREGAAVGVDDVQPLNASVTKIARLKAMIAFKGPIDDAFGSMLG
ncbi:MAG: hypothetical protein J7M16_11765 [Anaerolineae bacterium]|nr:hypothetical protein [Anaerolineae bacterium]